MKPGRIHFDTTFKTFSINHSDRIVFKLIDDNDVLFIEISSHEICY